MAAAAALYTPQILALATDLAAYPWNPDLPLQGGARSRSCGSAVEIGLATDGEGRIAHIALRTQACAIGQAAAAIFAGAARGKMAAEIREAHQALSAWLGGTGEMPDWPGLSALASARDYPGRHGAIVLAWRAASELLP